MSEVSRKIIKQAIKGTPEAVEDIYNLIAPEVYKICLRYANNNTEAQDLFHDGFLFLLKKLNKYSFKGSFIGWSKVVIRNFILERFRKNKKITFVEMKEEILENMSEEQEMPQDATEIMEIIQLLPLGYRTVFNLYVFENLSHKEIAKLLNISEGTSKSQYHKAKKYIRSLLKKKIKQYEKIG